MLGFFDKNSVWLRVSRVVIFISMSVGFILLFRLSDKNHVNVSQRHEENVINVGDVKNSASFSFAILGDTQLFGSPDSNSGFRQAIKSLAEMNFDFVMTVGDLIQGCEKREECMEKYEEWRNVASLVPIKIYPVVGNHDRINEEIADEIWRGSFRLPNNGPVGYEETTYSFDFNNSHFIVLNSEKPHPHEINTVQLEWLEKDLENTRQENTFVFFHEPAFPSNYKITQSLDYYEEDRNSLWKIIDKYDVTAVFNGHEHVHTRRAIDRSLMPELKKSIYQFIVGNTDAYERFAPKQTNNVEYRYDGQDFMVVNVEGKNIKVNLYSVEGKLVNEFKFSK
jgi:Icc-related predicted phosphoesterase